VIGFKHEEYPLLARLTGELEQSRRRTVEEQDVELLEARRKFFDLTSASHIRSPEVRPAFRAGEDE
jgi:hypothetical protein